ncbi:MAG: DUF5714 domain-containing protein [Paraclostridium sp.]
MNKVNCLICNEEIVYKNETIKQTCYFCKEIHESSISCSKGHYVCDACHSSDAFTAITNYCLKSDSINPLKMAVDLMNHPSIKMHGPEHHYLVPAVLSTAFVNKTATKYKLEKILTEGQKRSKNVLGGFCGFYGACGAGVGCGIYASLIQESGPMNKEEWGLCNLMTSKALENISKFGGPRCCKRDTFAAIETAVDFTKYHLGVELERSENLKCKFNKLNKECLTTKCKFHEGYNLATY